MPTRRTVLLTTAAVGAAAAAGAGGWLWLADEADTTAGVLDAAAPAPARWKALKDHLRAHFHYLQLPDATLDAFVDAAKAHGKLPKSSERLGDLRRQFLMSTDFLLKDGDESRPVGFVAWYDPYTTPCWNPLMRSADATVADGAKVEPG